MIFYRSKAIFTDSSPTVRPYVRVFINVCMYVYQYVLFFLVVIASLSTFLQQAIIGIGTSIPRSPSGRLSVGGMVGRAVGLSVIISSFTSHAPIGSLIIVRI